MKSSLLITTALAVCHDFDVSAFSSFNGNQLQNGVKNGAKMTMEYIPSGISKEQWRKIKEEEAKKTKGRNLGKVGITSFESRTFADWQKSGGKNLFPVDPKKVKSVSEIPYMQRAGGSADGKDLRGGPKKSGPTFFQIGGKKKEPEPEQPKPKNWWTLN